MGDEAAGKPPVVILREGTNVTSGTANPRERCSGSRICRSTAPYLRPPRLDKMMYKTDGTTAVTNDGAKIVAELWSSTQQRKCLSQWPTQENSCGDGVTGTLY